MSESRKTTRVFSNKAKSDLHAAITLFVFFLCAGVIGSCLADIIPWALLNLPTVGAVFVWILKKDLLFIKGYSEQCKPEEFPTEMEELYEYEYNILKATSSFFKDIAQAIEPSDKTPAMLFSDDMKKPHLALIEMVHTEDAQLENAVPLNSPTPTR